MGWGGNSRPKRESNTHTDAHIRDYRFLGMASFRAPDKLDRNKMEHASIYYSHRTGG